jgi:hypothetical protein
MKSISKLLMSFCVLCFYSYPTRAALIPIAFTAEVIRVTDDFDLLSGNVSLGDTMTGVYIYDTSIPDLYPETCIGQYVHSDPPCGITLTIGSLVFMTDPENVEFVVTIYDSPCVAPGIPPPAGGQYDSYSIRSSNNFPLPNGTAVREILLAASGDTTIFSSDALPTTAPDINAGWRENKIDIDISGGSWENATGVFYIEGVLSSVSVIPEPATMTLIGLGALVFLRVHRPSGCKANDRPYKKRRINI